jgi:putative tricarboxylic transport membrane protein
MNISKRTHAAGMPSTDEIEPSADEANPVTALPQETTPNPSTDASGSSALEATADETHALRAARLYSRSGVVSAALFLVLSAVLVASGLTYGLTKSNVPGPGLFPLVLGLILAVLSIMWLADKKQRDPATADDAPTAPDRKGIVYIVTTLAAGAGFIAVLGLIGYQLAMLFYTALLLRFISHRSWFITMIMAAAFSFGTYLIFVVLLGVPLPAAQIPFLNSLGL